jgi:hypothetical protein
MVDALAAANAGQDAGLLVVPFGWNEDCDRLADHFFRRIADPISNGTKSHGWLLAVVWRARENRSDLAVFNATDVGTGPVALVQLGHRVPDGFHGNWVAAA